MSRMADPRKRASSYSLAMDNPILAQQKASRQNVRVLLIGKTGNGKSSIGNMIVRRSEPVFKVSAGILSTTTHTELGLGCVSHDDGKLQMEVVDFPDVSDMEEDEKRREVEICSTLTFPFPTTVFLVVRADVRFTPEEYAIYQELRQLLGITVTKSNMIVVFSMADRLPSEQRNKFDQQLEKANKELKQVLQDANNHYVLLSNIYDGNQGNRHNGVDDVDAERKRNQAAFSQLTNLIVAFHEEQGRSAGSPKRLRAVLLGAKGSGKSAAGNVLLFPDQQFVERPSVLEGPFDRASTVTRHFQLEILDTHTSVKPDEENVRSWITDFGPTGPDVFIFLLKADDHLDDFKEKDTEVLNALAKVVKKEADIYCRLIILFSGADRLEQKGKSLDQHMKSASPFLKNLLAKAQDRFVLFDSKVQRDSQRLVLQRNRLLRMMGQLVEDNKGKPLNIHKPVVVRKSDQSVKPEEYKKQGVRRFEQRGQQQKLTRASSSHSERPHKVDQEHGRPNRNPSAELMLPTRDTYSVLKDSERPDLIGNRRMHQTNKEAKPRNTKDSSPTKEKSQDGRCTVA